MTDVLIIGGGLAGLSCARVLQHQGVSYTLLEASDALGGRVRTDEVDGFLLDRGFQVLLTAYPETERQLDYQRLGLRSFYDGALVFTGRGFQRVADPRRQPSAAWSTLRASVGSVADKLRILRLRQAVTRPPLQTLFERPETSTLDALRTRYGFSDTMIERFFRPFFGGIFLDQSLAASSRMFEFVFRMFSTGTAALPAGGIQAIPRQLAEPLPAEAIRLNTRVVAVDASGAVTTEAGETLQAQAVVVATEAPAAAQLLGAAAKITPLDAKSTTCLYYAADRPPVQDPVLMLSGDGRGPVNNVSVLTNVAPSYGPPGQALLSVVVLGEAEADDASLDRAVRTQLTGWFGPEVGTWRHLRTYRVRYALPDQAPPFLTPLERPIRLAERLFVCGDHRQTASLNGALVSGRHAGEMVAALMATGP